MKRKQLNLFREERKVAPFADTAMMRIFMHTCIENVRDGIERGLPPHEIQLRKDVARKVWRALDDARVRVNRRHR